MGADEKRKKAKERAKSAEQAKRETEERLKQEQEAHQKTQAQLSQQHMYNFQLRSSIASFSGGRGKFRGRGKVTGNPSSSDKQPSYPHSRLLSTLSTPGWLMRSTALRNKHRVLIIAQHSSARGSDTSKVLAGVGAAGAANNQGGGLGGYIARHKIMSLFTGLTAVFVTYQSTKAFYYWWYSDNNPCKTIKHPLIQKICLSDGIADNAEITHFLSVWDSNFGDQLASLQYQIRALPPEAKGKFDYLSQGFLPAPALGQHW